MSILKFAKDYVEGKGKAKSSGASTKKSPKKKAVKTVQAKRSKKVVKRSDINISLVPIVTEKGVMQQENGFVVFRAEQLVTKGQVKEAVLARYNTTVLSVKSMTMMPKTRRRGATVGKTTGWKKFYVKVGDIHKIVTGP